MLFRSRMVGDYQGIVPALNFDTPGFAVWVDTRTGSPDPFVSSVRRAQGSRFSAWRRLAFSDAELADLAVSGEAADPEQDGVPNLMEYGRGIDPHRADPAGLAIAPRTLNGLAGVEASSEFSVVADDLLWGWSASEDLRSWLPAPPDESHFSPGSTPDLLKQVSSFGIGSRALRFFRPTVQSR